MAVGRTHAIVERDAEGSAKMNQEDHPVVEQTRAMKSAALEVVRRHLRPIGASCRARGDNPVPICGMHLHSREARATFENVGMGFARTNQEGHPVVGQTRAMKSAALEVVGRHLHPIGASRRALGDRRMSFCGKRPGRGRRSFTLRHRQRTPYS